MKDNRSFTKGYAVTAAVLAVLGVGFLGEQEALAAPVTAKPAHRFIDTVGIGVKFSWGSLTYRTRYAEAKAALAELGIRHLRDSIGNTSALEIHKDLHNSLGVRLNAIVDTRRGSGYNERLDPSGIADELQRASTLGPRIIAAIEPPNEYNVIERDYGYTGWPRDLRAYQVELYRQVKSHSQLRSLPVLAPSLGGPDLAYYFPKFGDISAYSDFGNLHLYPNWYSFATKIEEILPYAKIMTPRQRIAVTETGWNVAINSTKQWVPEDVRVRYLPRAMADYARHPDLQRSFIYQLIDHVYDPTYSDAKTKGLIDYNLNRRKSYYAVRNMMHILCDEYPVATPGSLDFTLSGNLSDVRTQLYQKRSGSYSLLIWQEKQLYNKYGRLNNAPQNVTITFNQGINALRRYVPSDPNSDLLTGNFPKETLWATNRMSFSVPDHMIVIEVFPRGVPVTPVYKSCDFQPT